MPDQNSASTEHALIQELTAPLASLPDDPVPEVANVDFPVALRGYDRIAVDAYVKRTAQLVAELNAGRSPQAAVRRALERVGEDVSGILQRAHETAEQITAQSRVEAEDRLESARRESEQLVGTARQEADAMLSEARGQLRELDAETDRIWAERHRIVEDAHNLASQLLTLAEAAVERFPAAEDHAMEVEKPFDAEDAGELPEQSGDPAETPVHAPLPGEVEGDANATAGLPPDEDATVVLDPIEPLEHDAE
jgi:DivIVA domain-containing protein